MRDWALSDEGRGQPPEQSPYLFRKYARAGSSDGGIRGSGLGLAICKGLVEAPGGRIRAESGGTGLGTRHAVHFHDSGSRGDRQPCHCQQFLQFRCHRLLDQPLRSFPEQFGQRAGNPFSIFRVNNVNLL